MKHIDEFRDPAMCGRLIQRIRESATKPWVLMDVCGGQTHGLLRSGIEQELMDVVELVHGPGCPVCVTPAEAIDFAIQLSMKPGIIVTTFGDMLRVPGSEKSLLQMRGQGGKVKPVYSPMDAVNLARQSPEQQIVFFAVGFETTAPATALAVLQAEALQLDNFSVIVSHVRVEPAMRAIMNMPGNRVQAFIAAGHVATVTGCDELNPIAAEFQVPVVVTGFEPIDLLMGILGCVDQLEKKQHEVSNHYGRSVSRVGNASAKSIIDLVYEVATRPWRGLGEIYEGGFRMRKRFTSFDAEFRFGDHQPVHQTIASVCLAGDVMSGKIKPPQCSAFGRSCTPIAPLGAPMVSSEGACAAYYRFQQPMASPGEH